MIKAVNHVAIVLKKNQENEARQFYGTVLGLQEIPKPAVLQSNGGVWFSLPGMQLHCTVQDDFDPSLSKAHIAYEVENLSVLEKKLEDLGYELVSGQQIPSYKRSRFKDPFGNTVEIMQKL